MPVLLLANRGIHTKHRIGDTLWKRANTHSQSFSDVAIHASPPNLYSIRDLAIFLLFASREISWMLT